MSTAKTLAATVLGLVLANESGATRADFALRDGDTVVFLGDSITAARTYGKIIENYTLLRFPDRKIRFVNAGWGGDTAEGGLKRLERDVFSRGATVLIVAYGVNDIGWGLHADAEHKKRYLDAIRGIVAKCRERGTRAFLCSAAITSEDPDRAETGFLQTMCDEGMALSRSLGGEAIDVARSMRVAQRKTREAAAASRNDKDRPTMHAADGVHLNELGQLAMAVAILEGLGAPADVSSAAIDARDGRALAANGCTISNVNSTPRRLEFDRLDERLPFNFGPLGSLQFRFVPVPEKLNRYMLRVEGLEPGRQEITVDGRRLGSFSADQLARGVNIASATADGWEPGGPWHAQAATLIHLTDARHELATASSHGNHWLPRHPSIATLAPGVDELNARLETLQRAIAKPATYHFVIEPAAEEPSKKP